MLRYSKRDQKVCLKMVKKDQLFANVLTKCTRSGCYGNLPQPFTKQELTVKRAHREIFFLSCAINLRFGTAGIHLETVFWLSIMVLTQISSSFAFQAIKNLPAYLISTFRAVL